MLPRDQYPTAIIHCPDCGAECNYVANSRAEMPTVYPGGYHPHERGSESCLKRQIRRLKKENEQLQAGLRAVINEDRLNLNDDLNAVAAIATIVLKAVKESKQPTLERSKR